jgi:hypothetical protein
VHQRIKQRGLRSTALPVVLCIGALGLTACDHGDKAKAKTPSPPRPPARPSGVAVVTIQSLPRIINASGTVTPWEEVPVGAETGGLTAVSVNAEEGQVVRQGQILVALNDTMLRAQLHQQEASVASAKATLAEAQAALGRSRELQAKGYLSAGLARHRHRPPADRRRPAGRRRRLAQRNHRPPGPGRHPRPGLGPDQPPQRHQGPDRLGRRPSCSASSATAAWSWTPRSPKPTCWPCAPACRPRSRPTRSARPPARSASSPPRSTPRPGSAWPASAWRRAAASARACSPAPRSPPALSPPRPSRPPPSSIARTSRACSWSTRQPRPSSGASTSWPATPTARPPTA